MARGRGKGGQEGQEAGTGGEQGESKQEELSHCWTLLSTVSLQGGKGGEARREGRRWDRILTCRTHLWQVQLYY